MSELVKFLERDFRVSLSDGRVFFGRLVCVDRQGNFVVADTRGLGEYPGTVCVNRRWITKLEVEENH